MGEDDGVALLAEAVDLGAKVEAAQALDGCVHVRKPLAARPGLGRTRRRGTKKRRAKGPQVTPALADRVR
jgi:hypothetical protein